MKRIRFTKHHNGQEVSQHLFLNGDIVIVNVNQVNYYYIINISNGTILYTEKEKSRREAIRKAKLKLNELGVIFEPEMRKVMETI